MDNQTRTQTIKSSMLKLGDDEASLTEIMYFAKAKLREILSAKPWKKALMAEAAGGSVFSKLKGKFTEA